MALLLPLGFLARERLPPLDRHVDVGGLDLDGVDDPPLLLPAITVVPDPTNGS